MDEKMIKEVSGTIVKDVETVINQKMDEAVEEVKEMTKGFASKEDLVEIASKGIKAEDQEEIDVKEFAGFMKNLKKLKSARSAIKATKGSDYQEESIDADGGYLVPQSFLSGVLKLSNAKGIARRYAKVIPMSTQTLNLNKVASMPAVGWVDEGKVIPKKKLTFAKDQLIAKKVAVIISSTLELIEDTTADRDIWNIAMDAVADAMLRFEDEQVFLGDGSGKNMEGILNNSNVHVYTLPAGKTSFSDIDFKDIVAIQSLIDEEEVDNTDNLRWYGHRQVLGTMRSLQDANKRPIFSSNGKTREVDGYEFVTVPVMPKLTDSGADKKFLIFGDLQAFYLGDRKKISFDIGEADGDFQAYKKSLRAVERIDGGVVRPGALVVVKTAAS